MTDRGMTPDLHAFLRDLGFPPPRSTLPDDARRAVETGHSDQWRPTPGDTEPPF